MADRKEAIKKKVMEQQAMAMARKQLMMAHNMEKEKGIKSNMTPIEKHQAERKKTSSSHDRMMQHQAKRKALRVPKKDK